MKEECEMLPFFMKNICLATENFIPSAWPWLHIPSELNTPEEFLSTPPTGFIKSTEVKSVPGRIVGEVVVFWKKDEMTRRSLSHFKVA